MIGGRLQKAKEVIGVVVYCVSFACGIVRGNYKTRF